MDFKDKAGDYFKDLQDRITEAVAEIDGKGFKEDIWDRDGGGGGRTRILEDGNLFEKAGVNFSAVHGNLSNQFADQIPLGSGTKFYATGLSLVFHPFSPNIPTVHANFRYLEKGSGAWFGGGADLSPCYPYEDDAIHFHNTLKTACDLHNPEYYSTFKKWCDDYFTIQHRHEMRGIGGIFFDYLHENLDQVFSFVRSVGDCFLASYLPIVDKRKNEPFGKREKEFQMLRRGRYAEFNLVYDRGTTFGLKTNGRTESILMSLPPLARWAYDYQPTPGTPEAKAAAFFQPKDWV